MRVKASGLLTNNSKQINGGCIFCDTIAGNLTYYKIAESEHALAILDINAYSPGHTLILPKEHGDIADIHTSQWGDIMSLAQRIEAALRAAYSYHSCRIFINTGRDRDIPHTHIHVMGLEKSNIDTTETLEVSKEKVVRVL